MAPTPASQLSLQNNVGSSYKNTGGAPALKVPLKKHSVSLTGNSVAQMVIPRSRVVQKGGSLEFINSGQKVHQGSVQCLVIIIIIYLLIRGFSGAATV